MKKFIDPDFWHNFLFFGVKSLFFCFLIYYFKQNLESPKELFVSNLYMGVSTLGLAAGIVAIAINAVLKTMGLEYLHDGLHEVYAVVERILKTLTVYYVIIWTIGQYGDSIYLWVLDNRQDAILVLLCAVFIYPIFKTAASSKDDLRRHLKLNKTLLLKKEKNEKDSP